MGKVIVSRPTQVVYQLASAVKFAQLKLIMILAKKFRQQERGQSNIIGFVLLIGMILVAATITLYFGTAMVGDLTGEIQGQDAEQTMREIDSRLSEVAFSDNLEHTLAFDPGEDQSVRIANDAEMIIELNGGPTCEPFVIPMGSLHYESDRHSTVTYQGGGVWKQTSSGNVMISPPDMEYKDGTLTFPSVNINGSVDGRVETLQAKKDIGYSRERSREYSQMMANCSSASKMIVTVESRYADVWGEYLESEVSENSTYDLDNSDPNNDSVTVTISEGVDFGVVDDENEINITENATVSTTVLGTEVSSETQTWWGDMRKFWAPITMGIVTDGEEMRPWPDGPYQPSNPITAEQNLNDRETQLSEWTHEFEVEAGTAVSVRATQWSCDDYDYVGSDTYAGSTWYHYNCADFGSINIRTDASAGENPDNVRVLEDDDEMPVLETGYRQRNGEEVLGPLLNETGHLQLEDNQVVFLFEITDSDATWEDAADDIGDPNYNDAVVLLEIEHQEGKEVNGGFKIRLTTSEVVIGTTDE